MATNSTMVGEGAAGRHRPAGGPDRLWAGWAIVRILLLVALMVWFNCFPDRVGVLISFDDPSGFVPLLSPEFHQHLPWLNLWWALALILNLAHLYYGHWRPATRWADIGLNLIVLIILLRLILGGTLVGHSRVIDQLVSLDLPFPTLDIVAKGVLAIVLVTLVVEMGRKLIRLLEGRPADA